MEQVSDFGAVVAARPFRIAARVGLALAAVATAVGIVAIMAGAWSKAQADDRAYAAAWTITGLPCPRIGPAWYGKLAIERPTALDFEGLRGDFAHGAVSCTEVDYDHGRRSKPFAVCQFSAPFALRLATPQG